jgi:hypothetical protein
MASHERKRLPRKWTDGKHQPERKSFYEAIAKTLQGAEQVLQFGAERAGAVRWSSCLST